MAQNELNTEAKILCLLRIENDLKNADGFFLLNCTITKSYLKEQ